MDDEAVLCWTCLEDITDEVQFDLFDEQICGDCNEKIEDFIYALRETARDKRKA